MGSLDLAGIGMTSLRTRKRLIDRLQRSGISDVRVLKAIENTPRHIFLDEALAHHAYEDTALPIGYGQTLSQPYIVAKMSQLLLSLGPVNKVLEVGSGSGYQTAILAQLVDEVFSVERIPPLLAKAKNRLQRLKLKNVHWHVANERCFGWPEKGLYDGILVTAAPDELPEELCQQLVVGGIMVIPVGGNSQELVLVERTSTGFKTRCVELVRFVPLIKGAYAK